MEARLETLYQFSLSPATQDNPSRQITGGPEKASLLAQVRAGPAGGGGSRTARLSAPGLIGDSLSLPRGRKLEPLADADTQEALSVALAPHNVTRHVICSPLTVEGIGPPSFLFPEEADIDISINEGCKALRQIQSTMLEVGPFPFRV